MSATGKNNFTTRIQRILGIAPNRAQRSQPVLLLLLLTTLAIGAAWSNTSPATSKNEPVIRATDIFAPLPARDSVLPQPVRARPAPTPKPAPTPAVTSKPSPKVTIDTTISFSLNGGHGGQVNKQVFLNQPEIIATCRYGKTEEQLQVLSYEVTVLPKNAADAFSFVSDKGVISNAQFSAMVSNLVPESKIYIDNVEVKMPGENKPLNLGGMVFKITE